MNAIEVLQTVVNGYLIVAILATSEFVKQLAKRTNGTSRIPKGQMINVVTGIGVLITILFLVTPLQVWPSGADLSMKLLNATISFFLAIGFYERFLNKALKLIFK